MPIRSNVKGMSDERSITDSTGSDTSVGLSWNAQFLLCLQTLWRSCIDREREKEIAGWRRSVPATMNWRSCPTSHFRKSVSVRARPAPTEADEKIYVRMISASPRRVSTLSIDQEDISIGQRERKPPLPSSRAQERLALLNFVLAEFHSCRSLSTLATAANFLFFVRSLDISSTTSRIAAVRTDSDDGEPEEDCDPEDEEGLDCIFFRFLPFLQPSFPDTLRLSENGVADLPAAPKAAVREASE